MDKKSDLVEYVVHDGITLAIIIRASFTVEGIQFFTPNDFSQQIGLMKREKGYEIQPHVHKVHAREVLITQEFLVLRSGKVRVDFYSSDKDYLRSRILYKGDCVLLVEGGHGFQMLEETEILEVKQGPYAGDMDKVKFIRSSNWEFRYD